MTCSTASINRRGSTAPGYERSPTLPLKMFLSARKLNDNTRANRKFHQILGNTGYELKYMEVSEGHNWNNWRPLIDDVLLYFYGTSGKK